MDWKEFITTLVGSLAWPVVAVIAAVLFRQQVAALLNVPLSRLKAGPLELEWAEQAQEVERAVTATVAGSGSRDDEEDERDRLMELAEAAPAAAVVTAFGEIEQRLRTILRERGLTDESLARQGGRRLAVEAAAHGAITQEALEAIRALSVLRNLAAHGGSDEMTPQRAREFVVLAQAVLYALGAADGPRRDSPPE